MKPTERRIVDYILEDPERVLASSISTLNRDSGTSVGSIVAFCKAVGARGYADFKILLAGELAQSGFLQREKDSEVPGETIFERVFHSHVESLKETLAINSTQTLNQAVDLIRAAKHIEIFSIGMSYPVGYTAASKFSLIGISASATADSHMQLIAATRMEKGFLAIGISCSGSTRETVTCLRVARERKASTMCLTNSMASPITKLSDVVLCATPSEVKYFQAPLASRVTQLALIDALFVNVALRSKRKVAGYLQRSGEKLLERRLVGL